MFTAALRDLVWRRRRFSIALVATGLVMSMSLVMSGLSNSFPNEVRRVLDALGGDVFLAVEGANGPFYPGSVIPRDLAPADAAGVLFSGVTVSNGNEVLQAIVLGVEPGRLGDPGVDAGPSNLADGGAVVSSELGLGVGATVEVAGRSFAIRDTVDGVTVFGGQPAIFLALSESQALFAGGQDVITFMVAPAGTTAPPGLTAFQRSEAHADLMRPMLSASDSILFVTMLLWIVAACIVGSVVFLSALERTRDFAVFKATGASSASIAGGLVLQAIILALAASVMATVLALILAPQFPMNVEIPTIALVRLPVLAVVVGVLASLVGLRRVLSIPPSAAFGGAT